MATDRHQAPSYPLRMPDELKARIQNAAESAGRSLHAELLHRLQRSLDFEQSAGATDLAPTVARMERDIARLEVDKAHETLTIRVMATTMRPLLDAMPGDAPLGGILEGATVNEWKGLCDAYIKNKIVRRAELDASFERLKRAEATVRDMSPDLADPIWEQAALLRATLEQTKLPTPKDSGASTEKP